MWKRPTKPTERTRSLSQSISEHPGDIASLMLFLLGVYDPFTSVENSRPETPPAALDPARPERARCAEPVQRCRVS
ncbi:hypothetical protein CA85_15110 [Allorhodopirellula solitaria]|uniref:Uncharacterized protein n=1 Tax=Allorhodopirellula solitaria TaxID=2527987 RepID=A0A5C5YFC7_9BACT|nr:hypothetical protein CA85_15110 [Allorhodopirellula solitaria]